MEFLDHALVVRIEAWGPPWERKLAELEHQDDESQSTFESSQLSTVGPRIVPTDRAANSAQPHTSKGAQNNTSRCNSRDSTTVVGNHNERQIRKRCTQLLGGVPEEIHVRKQFTEMAGLAQKELMKVSRRSWRIWRRQQRMLPKGAEPLTSRGDVDRGGIGWKGGCGSRVNPGVGPKPWLAVGVVEKAPIANEQPPL